MIVKKIQLPQTNDKFNFDDIVIKKKQIKLQPSLHQRNYPYSNKNQQNQQHTHKNSHHKHNHHHRSYDKYENKNQDNFQRIKIDIQKSKMKPEENLSNFNQNQQKQQNQQNNQQQQVSQQSPQSQQLQLRQLTLKDQFFSKIQLSQKFPQNSFQKSDNINIHQTNSLQNSKMQNEQHPFVEERKLKININNFSGKKNESETQKEKKQNEIKNFKIIIPEKERVNIPEKVKINIPEKVKINIPEKVKINIPEKVKQNIPEKEKIYITQKEKIYIPLKEKINIHEKEKINIQKNNNTYEKNNNTYEKNNKTYEKNNNTYEKNNNTYEKNNSTYEKNNNTYEKNINTYEKNNKTYEKNNNTYEKSNNTYEKNNNTYEKNNSTYEKNNNTYEKYNNTYEKNNNTYEKKDKKIIITTFANNKKSSENTSNNWTQQQSEKKQSNNKGVEKKIIKIISIDRQPPSSFIDLETELVMPQIVHMDNKEQTNEKMITLDNSIDMESDTNVIDGFKKFQNIKLDFQDLDKVQFDDQKEKIVEQIEKQSLKTIQKQTKFIELIQYFKFGNIKAGITHIAFSKIFCLGITNQNSGLQQEQSQTNDSFNQKYGSEDTKIDDTQEMIDDQEQSSRNSQNKKNEKYEEVKAKYSENLIIYNHNPKVNIKIIGLLNVFHKNELDPRTRGLNIDSILNQQKK